MQPAVSFIVPVYNAEKYLKECLESLVSQSLSNIEVLLVNDGSRDKSQNIIDFYCKKICFCKKEFRKKIGGSSSARNLGLQGSKGRIRYLCGQR